MIYYACSQRRLPILFIVNVIRSRMVRTINYSDREMLIASRWCEQQIILDENVENFILIDRVFFFCMIK